jgi:hypothetical protein
LPRGTRRRQSVRRRRYYFFFFEVFFATFLVAAFAVFFAFFAFLAMLPSVVPKKLVQCKSTIDAICLVALQNTTLTQRLAALDVGGGLYECLIGRAQHSSLGFIGDLQQQRGLSLVWFSES